MLLTPSQQLRQVELNFNYSTGPYPAELHLISVLISAFEDLHRASTLHLHLGEWSFHYFGRYGSALGLEREDPTWDLTHLSRAYMIFNLGNVDVFRAQGIALAYSTGDLHLIISTDAFKQPVLTILKTTMHQLRISLGYTGVENFTAKVWY